MPHEKTKWVKRFAALGGHGWLTKRATQLWSTPEILEKVLGFGYKEWVVFHELGKLYQAKGESEKAREMFQLALETAWHDHQREQTRQCLERLTLKFQLHFM